MNYAYNIEGQLIAVAEHQRRGELYRGKAGLINIRHIEEAGLGWYLLDVSGRYGSTILYDGDCTPYIEELTEGDTIEIIKGNQSRPDVFHGKHSFCVAFVSDSKGRTIFRSPGYNLDSEPSPK